VPPSCRPPPLFCFWPWRYSCGAAGIPGYRAGAGREGFLPGQPRCPGWGGKDAAGGTAAKACEGRARERAWGGGGVGRPKSRGTDGPGVAESIRWLQVARRCVLQGRGAGFRGLASPLSEVERLHGAPARAHIHLFDFQVDANLNQDSLLPPGLSSQCCLPQEGAHR
jgi:hypothetical protein